MLNLDDPRILEAERYGYLGLAKKRAIGRCHGCEEDIFEDEVYYEDTYNGRKYCSDCYADRFIRRDGTYE